MSRPIVLCSFILSETRNVGRSTCYVTKVKGDDGVDWEWTDRADEAAKVSYYWARRFMADRRACGIKTAQAREAQS